MKTMFLHLDKVMDVKDLVEITNRIPCNVYIQRGEYVIDAKSLMGIFSLDLTKPLYLISDKELSDDICEELNKFRIEGD